MLARRPVRLAQPCTARPASAELINQTQPHARQPATTATDLQPAPDPPALAPAATSSAYPATESTARSANATDTPTTPANTTDSNSARSRSTAADHPANKAPLIGNPTPQTAILRMKVMHQQLINPRLTHHQLLLNPVMRRQQNHPPLIHIQLARRPLIQWPTHQTAEIPGAKPDLGFEEESAELAVVAVEGGGGEGFGLGLPDWRWAVEVWHVLKTLLVTWIKASGVKKPHSRKGRTYSPCGSCISPLPT